ncbi:hypothetical protein LshimejAT787_1004470 [Lyophyllum shimeji]|uniref:Uncharacterized protein n=1 Tax=Lyophyllum shimeji TaxID=47721 RepID=A0A9P3UR35_LYOSH|nr:hypothetical protein LshimejAT787_1004470 [Lyophyllum shimeji]
MDSHWFSYNTYVGPGLAQLGNACMISVVLEEEASHHFSGIRLLVVHQPSEHFNTLSLEECHDPVTFGLQVGTWASHRQVLMRRSEAARCSKGVSMDPRPVCTLIFELVDASDDRYRYHTLVPRSPSEANNLHHARVAFDLAYPYNSSHLFILLAIKSFHSFHRIPEVAGFLGATADARRSHSGIDVHSMRVLPVTRRQQGKYAALPPGVLCHVVKLVLGGKPKGWRTALLSFGLVCKSWVHVLDLALGGFDEVEDEDRPGVLALARVLRLRPERGAAIRVFNPWTYEHYIDPSGEASIGKWQAILDIMRCAASVESVKFSSIHSSIVADFIRLLKELRSVRSCTMNYRSGMKRTPMARGHVFSMHGVQTFIADWEHLETLELLNWRDADPDPEAPVSLHLACNLRVLRLEGGKLTGPQLTRFAPHPTSHLKDLSLVKVQNLPNHDLLSFLNNVTSTLSRLVVLGCTFDRATADEEHAIDAAMPAMIALEHLFTDSSCVSAHAIARKPASEPHSNHAARTLIHIGAANLGMKFEDVAKAVEVTGWKAVDVFWEGAPDWEEAQLERTKQVARERGVAFECHMRRAR